MESRLRGCTAFLCGANLALATLLPATTILCAASSPAYAATHEADTKAPKKKPISLEERKRLQKRVDEVNGLLDEARQGKRDDAEKYVLLRHLLTNFASLQLENTDPQLRSAKQEWDELLRKHPEFKLNPPLLEIKEQRELREKTETQEQELEKKGENFVPKDARAKVFWSGQDMAVVHQFRVDFYQLPDGVECLREYGGKWQPVRAGEWQGATIEPRFARGDNEISLKPWKTISFGQKISAHGCSRNSKACDYFAVYSELIAPSYSYNDDEEMRILKKLHAKGQPYKFDKPNADYQEFYGAFSVVGKLLGQVPFKAEPPNKVLKALHVYPDGATLFGVGKAVVNEDDRDYTRFGGVEDVIAWSKDRGADRLPLQMALEKYPALKQSPWLK